MIATASVLRGGRTIVDRIVLAAALLFGIAVVGALLLAVWPWGLHPVPIAGSALTGLIIIATAFRRRPVLPRFCLHDAISLGAATCAAAFLAWPLLRSSETRRLAVVVTGEDFGRHITLFDAIQSTGGYLFQNWDTARAHVYEGMIAYPSGSHMVNAILDSFYRSSATELSRPFDACDHYLGFVIMNYTFMILAMAWSASWIAGGYLTLARAVPLIAFVTATGLSGEYLKLLLSGYPSEMMGIALATILFALLCRPLVRTNQQMVLVLSLIVAIGFTYYLFLLPASMAALGWIVIRRHRFRGHWPQTVIIGSCAAALAFFPLILGLTIADQAAALWTMHNVGPSFDYLIASACVVAVGLLTARGLGSRIWRTYLWCLSSCLVLSIGLMAVIGFTKGHPGDGYYTGKSFHLVLAVLVIGTGSLTLLHIPPGFRRWSVSTRSLIQAVIITIAIAGIFGFIRGDSPYRPLGRTPLAKTWWTNEHRNMKIAQSVMYLARVYPPTMPTLVVSDQPYPAYCTTLFLSVVQRTAGQVAPALMVPLPLGTPGRLEASMLAAGRPIRIVAESPTAYQEAVEAKLKHPELPITVVRSGFYGR
ncbi:MAG: hypothetical protein JXA67_19330 [Micromonosporaceae bacterium]|nr:hypothetical protein [Micromonosporaceae bacterium]